MTDLRPRQHPQRGPAPLPFRPLPRRVAPPPFCDTIRNPVTVCIAAYSRNANVIVTVSDMLLSSEYEAYEGALKCEPLHFRSSWFALYAGYPDEYDALRQRIKATLAPLEKPEFVDVLAATKAAYESEIVTIGDTEYLAPLGLSRTEFMQNGRQWLGDEFTHILRKLAKVRLATSLLVFGFDSDGGHLATVSEKGKASRRDNNPAFSAIGQGAFAALSSLNINGDLWLANFRVESILYKLCAAKFAAQSAVRSVGERTIAMVFRPSAPKVVVLSHSDLSRIHNIWLEQTIGCPPDAIDDIKLSLQQGAAIMEKFIAQGKTAREG